MNQLIIKENEIIIHEKGMVLTTSLIVAEKFNKRHKNVIQSIENLECSNEFSRLNFEPSTYIDGRGKEQPMYKISRDGFSMLTMGFTGKDAMVWKEKYIATFNAMENELSRIKLQKDNEEWRNNRLIGKSVRRELTDTVQEFVEYAKKQGSKNAEMYYSNVTLMEYRALFIIGREISKNFRDSLTDFQLVALATAERVAVNAIQEGMESGLNYREIFKLARKRIDDLGVLLGKSSPGTNKNLLH